MRFASVDNRSRTMWLLAGLGVLIWAALSVLLGGSSAHAAETPPKTLPGQSQQQASSDSAQAPRAQPKPQPKQQQQREFVRKHASDVDRVAVAAREATTAALQSQPAKRSLPVHPEHAAPQELKQAAAQGGPDRQARPPVHARGLHKGHARGHDDVRHASAKAQAHAHAHATDANHAHAHATDANHAHAHATDANDAHAQHPSRAASQARATSEVRAVPIAHVAVTAAADPSALPPQDLPRDSRGAGAQPPATPLSASSTASGPSASAGVLPRSAHMSDVLGPLLTTTHADDDVLPSGPSGTPDDSPD